jgi:hypothetical protein
MAFAFAAQAASAPVFYSDFGARGDGVTDDFDAIIRAHEYANEMGLPVKADPGAVYYIGDSNKTAVIQTDTDWGDARFIVDDDARTTNSLGHLFSVTSPLAPAPVTGVGTLRENQAKLEISLAYDAFVKAIDTTTTRYIRYVPDRQDSYKGEPQYDTFLVDRDGNVDPRTPVIWDFDNITSLTAYPIDPVTLTVRGGRFTTVVNQGNAPYATRNILVERSNVVIDGTVHDLDKEATSTAVYFSGFIDIENCADVTVKNVTVVGHKSIDGYDGYEFLIQHSLNVTILNCRQSNDICDGTLRGITGTNTCKNLVFDTVELNRVDSHKFVTGLTVKNSAVGWHGVTVTGKGTLLMENTKVRSGQQMITLRDDFGSTWNGEFLIRNCEYVPLGSAILVRGIPCRAHDFGYPCAMPEKLTIDGLAVDESELPLLHMGFRIFGGFVTVDQYSWNNLIAAPKHPYTVTREIAIRNLNVKSGLPWILSHNFILFRRFVFPNVKITELAQ